MSALLMHACRYKVGRKGVTPYSGLGIRARVVLICMVALSCYFFIIFGYFLVSFSPICYVPLGCFVVFLIIVPLSAMSSMPIKIEFKSPGMISLQDVSLVDACRYKVGGKGVTPYFGLGIRARVVLICMVALACHFFVYYFWLLFSVFFPICYVPLSSKVW